MPDKRPASESPVDAALRAAMGRATSSYAVFWNLCRNERIELLRCRLPASLVDRLSEEMQITREQLSNWLGLAQRRPRTRLGDEKLSLADSERVLGIARLIGQVETIVAESGDATGFNAAEWTGRWLSGPNRALAQRSPGDFMDTADGRDLAFGLVAQLQSGAYA